MDLLMLFLVAFIWWLTGVLSFLFWWWSKYDVTVSDVFAALVLGGPLGPVAWVVCWIATRTPGSNFWDIVVFHKRNSDG